VRSDARSRARSRRASRRRARVSRPPGLRWLARLLVATAFAWSAQVQAQAGAPARESSDPATSPTPFDGIEIIADEPGPGEVVTEDHTGTRTRIDARTLQRRDVTLGDVLARETGVQRRSSGGFGSFASITVRAASAAQTAVLLDGIRLNSAGSPVVDLETLDLLSLDGIDVYRGITPIEFGAGAIGGAVALSTPRVAADAPPRVHLGIAAGSFGLTRVEGARIARDGRWDSVLSASFTRADNDFPFVDDNGTPLNAADDRRERRNNADAQRASLLAKLGTAHGNGARTDLLLQLGARRLGVPELRNRPDNTASFDTGTAQLQLRHAHEPLPDWQAAHTAYLHGQRDRYDDRLSQVGLGRQDTSTRSRTLGLDSAWSRALGAGELGVKAELRRETLAGRDRLADTRNVDARRDRLSLGARYSAWLPGGRWVLAPALTVRRDADRFDVAADDGTGDRDEVRRGDTDLSPAIGIRFDQDDDTSWHASLSRYSRQPAFAELFIDRGLVRGNPDLAPERGVNLDAGIERRFGAVAGGGPDAVPRTANGSLSVNVFASERREQIVTVFDARGVGRAENVGEARVLGVELAVRADPTPRWSLSANLTLQDAANRSDNPVFDDRQLPGEARVAGFLGASFRPAPHWRVRLEADTLRNRYYDTANKRAARDSTLVSAAVEHATRRFRTTLSLTNLGDRNVEDFNGFPRPGRAALLSLRYTPGKRPS